MTVVGSQAFAICREPGTDDLVFGCGEKDIAVSGVSVLWLVELHGRLEVGCRLYLRQGPFLEA